jgi:hypothetical protein
MVGGGGLIVVGPLLEVRGPVCMGPHLWLHITYVAAVDQFDAALYTRIYRLVVDTYAGSLYQF